MDPFTCSYAVFMRNRRRLYGPYMRGFSASSPAPQSVFTGRSLFSDRATEELYAQMGLNQRVVDVLYAELRPYLEPSTRAGRPFTGMTKLLCGLWFLANGSDQKSSSLALGISQSTFSHIIKAFLKGMRSILCKYIAIPSTDQEWESIKKRFYAIACIPNTVGVIDFKHVYFKIPGYLKGYPNHVTLQLICDPNLRILNMAARCPGYDSDSSIFYNSNIYNIFQDDLSEKGWLLGDSGFPCLPWLMTPVVSPHTTAEEVYNKAHAKTRSVVDRCFGIMKTRFRCLDVPARPATVIDIAFACAVLHNMAIHYNRQDYINLENHIQDNIAEIKEEEPCPQQEEGPSQQGLNVRRQLISVLFR